MQVVSTKSLNTIFQLCLLLYTVYKFVITSISINLLYKILYITNLFHYIIHFEKDFITTKITAVTIAKREYIYPILSLTIQNYLL